MVNIPYGTDSLETPNQRQQHDDTNKHTAVQLRARAINEVIAFYTEHASNPVDFYNQVLANPYDVLVTKYLHPYIISTELYRDNIPHNLLSKEELGDVFLRGFLVNYATKLDTTRKVLRETLHGDYAGLNDTHKTEIQTAIEKLNIRDMEKLLGDNTERERLIDRLFEESRRPVLQTLDGYLHTYQIDPERVNAKAREVLKKIFVSGGETGPITSDDIRILLSLFPTPTARRVFLRAFLPSLSVGRLLDSGIITLIEAEEYRRRYIAANPYLQTYTSASAMIQAEMERVIGFDSIMLPLSDSVTPPILTDDQVDRIASGDLAQSMTREFNARRHAFRGAIGVSDTRNRRDRIDEIAGDYEWIRAGEVASQVNFSTRLHERFRTDASLTGKFEHTDIFGAETVLKGKVEEDGKLVDVYFQIDHVDQMIYHSDGSIDTQQIILRNLTTVGGIKGVRDSRPEPVTYDEFVVLLKSLKGGTFTSKRDFYSQDVRGGGISVIREDEKIENEAEMTNALDVIDPNSKGKHRDFQMGMTFEMKDGEKTSIFSIAAINSNNRTLCVTDGHSPEAPIQWTAFLQGFRGLKCRRIDQVHTPQAFLADIQNRPAPFDKIAESFKGMEYKDNRFVPATKKTIDGYPGMRYFTNTNKDVLKIEKMDGDSIEFVFGEKYDESNGKLGRDKKGTWKTSGKCSYQFFLQIILAKGLKPHETKEEIDTTNTEPIKENRHFLRSFMQGLSWAQIAMGSKQYLDHLKHRLERGSKHNATLFAYGMGEAFSWLPILGDTDFMLELKAQLSESKWEMISKLEKRLDGMGGDDRRKLIEEILLSKASQDTDIFACTLAKIKDGGRLYTGSHLSKYAGSRLFFRKLGGTDAKWDEMKAKFLNEEKADADAERPMEENIIWMWAKSAEKEGFFPMGFHSKFKAGWAEGKEKDKKKGTDEADLYHYLTDMVKYGVGKAGDGEYDVAWGAMLRCWGKHMGDAVLLNKLPFIFSMGFAMEDVPGSSRSKMKDEYLANKRNFPSIYFVRERSKAYVHRRVVRRLIERHPDATAKARGIAQLDKIYGVGKHGADGDLGGMYANRNDTGAITKALSEFWDEFGGYLIPKLNMARDRTIEALMDEMSERGDNDFKTYYEATIGNQSTGWQQEPNKSDVNEDGYSAECNPPQMATLLAWIHINPTGGTMHHDTYDRLWKKGVMGMLEAVRNHNDPRWNIWPDNPAKNEAFRPKVFHEYHHLILHHINEATKTNPSILHQPYIGDLIEFGFSKELFLRKAQYEARAVTEENEIRKRARATGRSQGSIDAEVAELRARGKAWIMGDDHSPHHESSSAEQQRQQYDQFMTSGQSRTSSADEIASRWAGNVDTILDHAITKKNSPSWHGEDDDHGH